MAKFFGTNGVRGRLDELTPLLAFQLAKAFGEWSKKNSSCRILVARDHRATGELLEKAVTAGLLDAGCIPVLLGIVPAPVAEWRLADQHADGLIIITASHNPPEWNALKMVDASGVSVSRETGEEIERLIAPETSKHSPSAPAISNKIMRDPFTISSYWRAVTSNISPEGPIKKKLRLVLDCGNGTASLTAPELFKRLGCEIITLNAHVDARFPGRLSEPTAANLSDLLAAVPALHADLGIAWDGDADRVIFVDENGRWIVGDQGFALSMQIALEEKKNEARKESVKATGANRSNSTPIVVTTVATSRVVEDAAKKYGAQVVYTKVGAPYLSEAMLKQHAVSGGEEVGGIIYPEFSLAKDGFYSTAKLVAHLSHSGKKLSQLVNALPEYHNAKTKLECRPEQKEKTLAALAELAKKMERDNERGPAAKQKVSCNLTDGIRLDFPDSWVIIRASGTENYFRVFAEAKTQDKAQKLMDEYAEKVKRMLK